MSTMADGRPAEESIDPWRAARELGEAVVRTPVRRLRWLEPFVGTTVFAKMECSQHTGSFKYRGARLAAQRAPAAPLIAASAGNHGLAVAQAGADLGLSTDVCIPTTASRLKRDRILATGAGLVEHGTSLQEAEQHASALAASRGLHYISPYNHPDVIAGSSTIGIELFDQVPELATVVVPVGGGGLISGLALGLQAAGASARIVGCEPERYASATASRRAGAAAAVLNEPTLADGLAVNIAPGSLTLGIMDREVEHLITLTEEELAAGTLALLVHESILVEPAGAASVFACLRLAAMRLLDGPVVLPLCGGNLHHTTLARILRYPFTDPNVLRLCELRGRLVQDEAPLVSRVGSLPASELPIVSRRAHVDGLVAQALLRLSDADGEVASLDAYVTRHRLDSVSSRTAALRGLGASVAADLADLAPATSESSAAELRRREAAARWGLANAAHLRMAMEWCSPSYAQSETVQFFDLGSQDSPAVNYERYGHKEAAHLEEQLAHALEIDLTTSSVLVTSSGMAAYGLIEAYLLRERLPVSGRVLLAPYVYFEAAEQIETLHSVEAFRASGWDVPQIIDDVRSLRPHVVFADPLANTVDQRMIDLDSLVTELEALGDPCVLVIDGTMLSGADVSRLVGHQGQVEVLYYESCSKYLQLGFDGALAGFIAVPNRLRPRFERLRRNGGSIITRHGAAMFPSYGQAELASRMARIDRATRIIAEVLARHPGVAAETQVIHPSRPDHPDQALADRFASLGGCITFKARHIGDDHSDLLEGLVDALVVEASGRRVPLTKGVSFGFSVCRVSAASSMAESEPAFLRLSVGDLDDAEARAVADVFACVLTERST